MLERSAEKMLSNKVILKFNFVGLLGILVSCREDSPTDNGQEARIAMLEAQVASLNTKVVILDVAKQFEGQYFMKAADQGYGVLDCGIGNVVVSVKGIEEYADGSKVNFSFGNPLMTNINGFKFGIEYGPVDENSMFQKDRTKTKEVVLPSPVFAASWTNFEVALPGVSPKELSQFRFYDVGHQGLILMGKPKEK